MNKISKTQAAIDAVYAKRDRAYKTFKRLNCTHGLKSVNRHLVDAAHSKFIELGKLALAMEDAMNGVTFLKASY